MRRRLLRSPALSFALAAALLLAAPGRARAQGTPAEMLAPKEGPVIPVFLRSVARTDHHLLLGAWGPMDFWAASPLTSVVFSPDGAMLFAAARNGEIVGWDLKRFLPTWSLQAPSDADQGASLAISPEGHLLFTPTRRAPVALDVAGKRVKRLTFPEDCGEGRCPVIGLGTFYGGGGMAVAGREEILVWKRGAEVAQLDAPRMKEGEALSAMGGSPRLELLALGTEFGRLVLWDPKKSRPVKQGAAHSGRVYTAQFLADGKRLVTAGADGLVKFWDGRRGTLLRTVRVIEKAKAGGTDPELRAIGFSFDGKLALTAAEVEGKPGNELGLWNLVSGRRLWKVQDLKTEAIAFSPDARRAALVVYDRGADDPRRIILLEVQSGISVLQEEGHLQRVTGLSVSPDGKTAVSCSLDGTIKRWDAATAQQTHVVGQHPGGVADLAVAWKRMVALSAGHDGAVRMWTVRPSDITGDLAPDLVPPRQGSSDSAVAPPQPPAGETLPMPHSLALSADEKLAMLPVSEVKCAIPEGADQELCAPTYRLRRFDLKAPRALRDLYFAERSLVRPPISTFLPEFDEVLVGFDAVDRWTRKKGPLRLVVRDDQGVPVRSFTDPDADTVRALALQPAGDLLLVATDLLEVPSDDRRRGTVWLWNWRVGKKVRQLVGHDDSVLTATFSGDGQRILTGSVDGTVRLWEVGTGRELEQLDLKAMLNDHPTAIAIASEASTFLIGTDKGALLQFQLKR